MAKIITPNKQYSGISASVQFVNGVGSTEDQHLIEWFKEHRYTVEEVEFEPGKELDQEEIQEGSQVNLCNGELETLKKEQLQELAAQLELEFGAKTTKEELIEMIKIAKEMEE